MRLCGIKRRFKGYFIYNVRFAGVSIFERLRAIFCKNTLELWGCNLFMCTPFIDYCFNIHMTHLILLLLLLLLVLELMLLILLLFCSVVYWEVFFFFYSFLVPLTCTEIHQASMCDSIATIFHWKSAVD